MLLPNTNWKNKELRMIKILDWIFGKEQQNGDRQFQVEAQVSDKYNNHDTMDILLYPWNYRNTENWR